MSTNIWEFETDISINVHVSITTPQFSLNIARVLYLIISHQSRGDYGIIDYDNHRDWGD